MSQVLWQKSMVPDLSQTAEPLTSPYYEKGLGEALCRRLDFNEKEANLPDRRAFRTMSRAAMLLSLLGLESRETFAATLADDPFRVGIYFAVENGPVDSESAFALKHINRENFASEYKRQRNPTMYLKQLPNLAAAHLGIFLGALGPAAVFTDSEFGSLHALDQAELDLEMGVVDIAIVGSAFTFENPLAVARSANGMPDRVICEGAGLIVLAKSENKTDWWDLTSRTRSEYFGIADQIIEINERGKNYAIR